MSQDPEHPFGIFDSLPTVDICPERLYEIVEVFNAEIFKLNGRTLKTKKRKLVLEYMAYEESSDRTLKLLSAWTMGIPCLLGMPANSVATAMKIKATLLDENGFPIKRFEASGANRTFIALYWGYGKGARTRSNLLAFKEAMDGFIENVEKISSK